MIGNKFKTYPDLALLLLRVVFGLYMAIGHGWGKMMGGPDVWARVGGTMAMFGLDFLPTFWGFMAAFSEFVASLLVAVGFVTRPAALLVGFTMLVASSSHLMQAESPEKAAMYLVAFLVIALYGPGKYSADKMVG
ncbi:DoxX family protein [Longibacter salinarum]|uniref:DoxX family protein n=1 Tax=Longibacter salinarum TaxID=1850348 RepID=A0A2A8D0R0_9BACT|nr:DoxX family protein [Longibacter salinarum]PEN14471.1 DoxX family protein [Longibacter salinarum]